MTDAPDPFIQDALDTLNRVLGNETLAWNTWNHIASPGPILDAILALWMPAVIRGKDAVMASAALRAVATDGERRGQAPESTVTHLRALADRIEQHR